jgi:threonine synthase
MKIQTSNGSLWRYSDSLPVERPDHCVTLGEGWTPLNEAPRTAQALGCKSVLVKDEGRNPTGSFKDRSASVTVSQMRERNVRGLVLSSTGNAGAAFSIYAARAGIGCVSIVPSDVLEANVMQIRHAGGDLRILDKWSDATTLATTLARTLGYEDVSAARTTLRIEGKKTLGFEIVEQLGWQFPDAVVCPTGGGTGILALQKAFNELLAAGLACGSLPRLFASQYSGCAPIVVAHHRGLKSVSPWPRIDTPRGGMRTAAPAAGDQVLEAIANGGAHAVTPAVAFTAAMDVTRRDGILIGPEGGTALAALSAALTLGQIARDSIVVAINTATPIKADPAFYSESIRKCSRHAVEQI